MKPTFHARLLNGPFDDPGLYVRFLRESRAVLFDLGFTVNLSPREILKITDIFVSHTHLDHFIGFDDVLRGSLKKDSPLRLYGPEGFTECIEGKLKGYTWNLIRNYSIDIEVYEVMVDRLKRSLFRSREFFKREEIETIDEFDGTLLRESFFRVNTAVFDHQVPCLAFSLEEDYHINIDKAMLKEMKLPVGPWLNDLKHAVRSGIDDRIFTINNRDYSMDELKGIVNITKGQKISYVVDIHGSESNIKGVVDLVKGSDVLYIEAYFLDEDRELAKERFHLTARQAGEIANTAGVRKLVVFHFSPRYTDMPERLIHEAQ
jgi:ribonuclease Z